MVREMEHANNGQNAANSVECPSSNEPHVSSLSPHGGPDNPETIRLNRIMPKVRGTHSATKEVNRLFDKAFPSLTRLLLV